MALVDTDGLITALNNVQGFGNLAEFKKALDSTSGFTGYNLEREAKLRLPTYAVLRNRVAVDAGPVGPMAGTQAVWKMQLGYGAFNFGANMGTAFGANGSDGNPGATQIAADYKSQSIHGSVQLEAIDFARGFDDPIKVQSMFNLSALLRIEELLVTGGNAAALDAPIPTGAGAGSGSIFASGDWTVKVTAVTLEGKLRNDTGAANYGESVVGTATITTTAKLYLDVEWPVVEGAVGYKVYCSAAYDDSTDVYLLDPATEIKYKNGDAFIPTTPGQKWIGVNHIEIVSPPAGSVAAPSGDTSASLTQPEGFVAWCTKSTIYSTNLSSAGPRVFTDMDGGLLTSEASGVHEINTVLQQMWNYYHTAPTLMVGSPATIRSITNRIAGQNSGAMMRLDITQERNKIVGGLMVGGYVNQFAQNAGMSTNIDLIAHPYLPDGILLLMSETLPPDTYRFAQDSRCFALDVLKPYTYWQLASTDRNINFDIYFTEVLKCYYPTAQGAIAGIRVDS